MRVEHRRRDEEYGKCNEAQQQEDQSWRPHGHLWKLRGTTYGLKVRPSSSRDSFIQDSKDKVREGW